MLKSLIKGSVLLLTIIVLAGCAKVEIVDAPQIKKPVEIMKVKHDNFELKRVYTGRIGSDSFMSLSFLSPGKIVELSVVSGDYVKKGQLLARLDSQVQGYGVTSGNAQVQAAAQVVEKAKIGVSQLEKTLNDMKVLYDAGAISKADLEATEVQTSSAKADLKAAQAQLAQAQAGLGVNNTYLKDTKIYAPKDGKILEVLYKKDDLIAAGYPVILIEGEHTIATFGLPADVLIDNNFNRKVEVVYGERHLSADITEIHQVPDSATQTYQVDITLPEDTYLIGTIVDVYVTYDTVRSVKLPMNIVLSGESDFIYVVENGKAVKKNIEILSVQDNFFYVSGLTDDDQVIYKGMKLVNPLDDVEIVKSIGDDK